MLPLSRTRLWWTISILGFAAVVLVLHIRVTQARIVTVGLDRYQYHRPLWGKRTVAQEVLLQSELHAVGAILVDFRRANVPVDVPVRILDATTRAVLAEAVIPSSAIRDDQFATVALEQPVATARQKVLFEFSAPQATEKNPVGIRFHPQEMYPAGTFFDRGAPQEGDAAVLVRERVPAYRYLATTIMNRSLRAQQIAWSLAGALIAASAATSTWKQSTAARQRVEIALLVLLGLLTVALHLYIIPELKGFSGGDPYNYLAIAKKLTLLDNPFAGDKRLPGYPLLLIPAIITTLDAHWWMLFLSALAAGGTIVATAWLARTLALPWNVQLTSALLLTIHKDFFWTSLRPEPYTLYALCVLAALLLFFRLHRSLKIRLIFGAVLGYAAMVRQEGLLLAVVLGIFSLLFARPVFLATAAWPPSRLLPTRAELARLGRRWGAAFIPALMIVLPLFAHNTAVYGNPLYTPYFKGERLQIVDSVNAFVDSLGAAWGIIGSTWWPMWDHDFRVSFAEPAVLLAIAATLLWASACLAGLPAKKTVTAVGLTALWLVAGSSLLGLAFFQKTSLTTLLMHVTAGTLIAAAPVFLWRTRWRGAVVLTVALTQGLIAVWFHPYAKHFQQVYPIFTLALAAAVCFLPIQPSKKLNGQQALAVSHQAIVFLACGIVAVFLLSGLRAQIDKHNAATAADYVVYRAVQAARRQDGPYAFDQPYLPVRIFFGDTASYFQGEDLATPAQERAWLAREKIATLVVTSASPAFRTPDPAWQRIKYTVSEGRDEQLLESWVYRVSDYSANSAIATTPNPTP